MGLAQFSYRLCYGEGDFLPGLIVDRYRSAGHSIFVVQAHTAGADLMLPHLPQAFQAIVGKNEKFSLIIKNNLGVRKLEGIPEEKPKVEIDVGKLNYHSLTIDVASVLEPSRAMPFTVDLVEGQKTGFFLDQASNVRLAAEKLSSLGKKKIRILDLCCYVGQWSTQLASVFKAHGAKVDVLAVDGSAKALEFAQQNITKQGAQFTALKGDVLKDLAELEASSFDIVISDPPALIQGRKEIPQGTHAYLQLNTQSLRLLAPGGGIIACSCSALMEEESFLASLSKASARNQRRIQWVGRGAQASDHPMLSEFPEGRYLKCFVGVGS
jgi:23S rRNA (cytosine1962-C5)-methyltransferase